MPSREHYGHALQLRADLWRVLFSMFVGAVLLFLVTVMIDRGASLGTLSLPRWISIGGPEDARAILGAMLGAVSTVLALIFSVALLVLSMAVSNFGPRILYRPGQFVMEGGALVQVQARLTGGAFNQIRQAATGNPAVSIRLLQTFARLAEQSGDPAFREALWQQVDAVWEAVSAETMVKSDRADVENASRRACLALGPR